jgi:hypothetical protein
MFPYLRWQFLAFTNSLNGANGCQALIFGLSHSYQGHVNARIISDLYAGRRGAVFPQEGLREILRGNVF